MHVAFGDITVRAALGQFVSVIGRSGAGKSTQRRRDGICYGGMMHGVMPMSKLIDTASRGHAHRRSLRQALR